jgi:hypothetical protein
MGRIKPLTVGPWPAALFNKWIDDMEPGVALAVAQVLGINGMSNRPPIENAGETGMAAGSRQHGTASALPFASFPTLG